MCGWLLSPVSVSTFSRFHRPSPSVTIGLLLLSVWLLDATIGHAQESEWEIQGVDCPKQFVLSTRSLRLDSLGNPHIAYGFDNLYYAWYAEVEWHVESIDDMPGVGEFAALALDTLDRPCIAYFDDLNDDLKYAWRDEVSWHTEVVSTDAYVHSISTDIALDSSGNPHILFTAEGGLGYAHHDGTSWYVEVLEGELQYAGYFSLALDSDDHPNISYYRDAGLNYASWNGVEWICTFVAEQSGMYTSLVLDNEDHPCISHHDWFNNDLAYSWWDGYVWRTETVDQGGNAGERSGIALDGMGHPHIVYTQGSSPGYLKYARWNGSEWLIETVECEVYQFYPSISLDASSTPHIAYCSNQPRRSLIHAARTESSWQSETVDLSASVGTHVSMALDSLDYPHMSYFDKTNQELKYAFWDGASWSVQAIDGEGCVGTYTSLAIDSLGNPHITYFGCQWDLVLRYAHWDGVAWYIDELDESEYNGVDYPGYTSLTLDEEDQPHISYYLDTDLHYATWDGIQWHFETVESEGTTGKYCSIAINRLGQPQICHHAHTGMRYASKNSSGWQIEVVEESGGFHIALTLDSQDWPHISYCYTESGGYGPRYAFRDSSGWHHETIEGWYGVGWYASIAVDSLDRPHISYCHSGNYALKFAWKDGDIWHNGVVDSDLGTTAQTSIVLDSSGYRHIAYYDGRLGDLKYAFSTGEGLWTDSPLPNLSSLQLRIEGPVPCLGYARVTLTLPAQMSVRVSVHDIVGRQAHGVHHGQLSEGEHRLIWNGADDRGRRAPSGTYIISAEAGGQRVSKRIVVIR